MMKEIMNTAQVDALIWQVMNMCCKLYENQNCTKSTENHSKMLTLRVDHGRKVAAALLHKNFYNCKPYSSYGSL